MTLLIVLMLEMLSGRLEPIMKHTYNAVGSKIFQFDFEIKGKWF